MPAYIEVTQNEKPTCGRGDDCELNDNVTHHVSVKIGPAILKPFAAALDSIEMLIDAMGDKELGEHDAEMSGHESNSCAICSSRAALKRGRRTLKAISGRAL